MKVRLTLFAEIPIKSRPVRIQMQRRLMRNVRATLKDLDPELRLTDCWDCLELTLSEQGQEHWALVRERLARVAGIADIRPLETTELADLEALIDWVLSLQGSRLAHRRFALQVRRRGKHDWDSVTLKRRLGQAILKACPGSRVDLSNPEVSLNLVIREQRVELEGGRIPGLGGYPTASIGSALVLISGGYDSAVAAYEGMRRGLRCHFLFFNLGGPAHETAVQHVAHQLWLQYGSACKVRFVSVPFGEFVAALKHQVHPRNRGVVLKRAMFEVADLASRRLRSKVLVTGESICQVASQTLENLQLIDQQAAQPVIRPLATWSKEEIIVRARQIGIAGLVEGAPEYCGELGEKPAAKAREGRVVYGESRLPEDILQQAWASASIRHINEIVSAGAGVAVPEWSYLPKDALLVDIRPDIGRGPVPGSAGHKNCQWVPHYQVAEVQGEWPESQQVLLYCDQGAMSRRQAAYLNSMGERKGLAVGVYVPERRPPGDASEPGVQSSRK